MRQLAVGTRRLIIGAALVLTLACLANLWLGWSAFRGFDRQALVFAFVVLAFALHFFPITRAEMRAYREEKAAQGRPGD